VINRMTAERSNQGVAVIEQTHENVAHSLCPDEGPAGRAHGTAVAQHAYAIALAMGLTRQRAERIRLAGTLHDAGKSMISEEILEKPGPLSAAEWRQVRLHPVVGEHMLLGEGLGEIATWVRGHHERYDGAGYPDRLAGSEIPLEARILAVADAYDAMISERPYKATIDPEQAAAELRREAGAQFDPRVVDVFLRSLRVHAVLYSSVDSGNPLLAVA
jgi:two-component system cell cycle response regulator